MIRIEERPAKKSVGKTSLYVSFNYNQVIVESIKAIGSAVYNGTTHEWELPISKLSELIDVLTYLDDITLTCISDEETVLHKQTVSHKIAPYKHQTEAIDWLINRETGLVLDAPGLGKTTEIIYTAEELKAREGINHCLIICCVNTLKQNWKKEIEKFSTEKARVVGEKISSKGKISYASVKDRAEELYNHIDEFFVILNMESLRDSTVVEAILNSKNKFGMVAVDEVHRVKDPNSQASKGLKKLINLCKYRYCLSGTILVNSPFDAYVPLTFIGYEKSCWSNFKSFYGRFESQFGHMQLVGYKNVDVLKDELSECSIRRTKDILDLPPKTIVPEYLEMSDTQYRFYQELEHGIILEADRVNIKNSSLLGMITRLRQAATCPSVLSTTATNSVKLDRCCELVQDIVDSGEKVIIFSTFKDPLYKLLSLLSKYNPLICTGDQSDEEVSSSVDLFQTDDVHKVILCTAQRMGTGLTLHRASYEIFLDSNWTAAMEEQAEDRAHRLGMKQSLTIYKLIAKGTIDERIQNILQAKSGISQFIIDDNENQRQELRKLLGMEHKSAW